MKLSTSSPEKVSSDATLWGLVRMTPGHEVESVFQHVTHRGETLGDPLRRSRQIENQRIADRTGNSAREPTEWADCSHSLAETGRQSLEHEERPLGSLITRGEARAARGDDKAAEVVAQATEGDRDTVGPIANDHSINHREARLDEQVCDDVSRSVVSRPVNDRLRDGHHLGLALHASRLGVHPATIRGSLPLGDRCRASI